MNKYTDINREQYEEELANRRKRHLEQIQNSQRPWQPCLHDACPSCHGTGIKLDGTSCIHCISCPCPKCSTTY